MINLYTQISPYLNWAYRCDYNKKYIAYTKVGYTGKVKLITGKFLYGQFYHLGYLFTCKIIKTTYGYAVLFEVGID